MHRGLLAYSHECECDGGQRASFAKLAAAARRRRVGLRTACAIRRSASEWFRLRHDESRSRQRRAPVVRSICPAIMGSWAVAIGHYSGIVRAVLGSNGLERPLALGLWLDSVAGTAGFRVVRAAVHHPARLRAWLVFCEPASQSMGRRLPRVDYIVPLRVLEEDPRRAPRDLGEPRSARVRRYPHTHGSRVSENAPDGAAFSIAAIAACRCCSGSAQRISS